MVKDLGSDWFGFVGQNCFLKVYKNLVEKGEVKGLGTFNLRSIGKLRRVKLRRSSQLWRKLIRRKNQTLLMMSDLWDYESAILLINIISETQLSWKVLEMSPSPRVSGLKVAKPLISPYLPANLAGLSWETSQVWTWTQKKNLGSTGILKTIIIKIHNNVHQFQKFKGNRRNQQ